MRKAAVRVGLVLFVLTLSCLGQDKNANFGRVFVTVPKPGMVKQFEEGRKRHVDFHRKQADTWSFDTFQVETGPEGGSYVTITFGHTWKDFDTWDAKMGDADTADAAANMDPYTGGGETSIWMYMPNVSHPAAATAAPSKLAEVTHFYVDPGSADAFETNIGKINDVITKAKWGSPYSWYSLVNGGDTPHYVLVIAHDNWADFAEPNPSFMAMLEQGLGKDQAAELMNSTYKAIRKERTEVIRYRPDLSYRPGK